MMKKYVIKGGLVRGIIMCRGGAGGGYGYMPFDSAHRSSRKAHATPEAAIKGRITGARIIEATDIAAASIIAKGGNPV